RQIHGRLISPPIADPVSNYRNTSAAFRLATAYWKISSVALPKKKSSELGWPVKVVIAVFL
ncbi:hypothetical protein, partial [Sphingobium sp. ba1]|uniref:hypothetical protein n=1 Tax=Sphingobium sp. ba1 TaxID=1522072 RepID=UPI001ED98D9E